MKKLFPYLTDWQEAAALVALIVLVVVVAKKLPLPSAIKP